MPIFKKALKKAIFLDFVSDLKKQILNLGDVPYNEDVYLYAIHFFSVLNKNMAEFNRNDMSFLIEKTEPSLPVLRLVGIKNCLNSKMRIHSNGKITLDGIFLFNNPISLRDYQQKPAQPMVQKQIYDRLVKKRDEILNIIDNLQQDLIRPNPMILQVAGYNNLKRR